MGPTLKGLEADITDRRTVRRGGPSIFYFYATVLHSCLHILRPISKQNPGQTKAAIRSPDETERCGFIWMREYHGFGSGLGMKQNRNAPCSCGSGKKAKQCCMRSPAMPASTQPNMRVPMKVIQRSAATDGIIRSCDGCQACCAGALTINDPELVVSRGVRCPNLNATGCSIHGPSLPKTCSGFVCSYLVEPGDLSADDRPDRVGAIVRLVRNNKLEPPLDRVVHLNECMPEGLQRILANPNWGTIILNDVMAGIPLLCSFWDDDHAREIIHLRFEGGRLRCELTSCQSDGSPILQPQETATGEPLYKALMIPQGFAFETDALISQLGSGEQTVLGPSVTSESGRRLGFCFTRRQANLIDALTRLIHEGPARPGTSETPSTTLQVC